MLASSPASRAYVTADVLRYELFRRRKIGLEIVTDVRLMDRQAHALNNCPVPGGVSLEQFKSEQAHTGYADVESFDEIQTRLRGFLSDALLTFTKTQVGIVSTHQDTIHATVAAVEGIDESHQMFNPGVPPGSITVIVYKSNGGLTEVITFGQTHLQVDDTRLIKLALRIDT